MQNISPAEAAAELRRRGLDRNGKPIAGAVALPEPSFNTVRGAPPGVMSNQLSNEDRLLSDAKDNVSRFSTSASQANRFQSLMDEGQNTGGLNRIPGAIGLQVIFGNQELQEMEQINNALAPLQRQAGSGPMSDKDLAVFQRSIVSPEMSKGANEAYVQNVRASARRAREYLEFMEKYRSVHGVGSLAEAGRIWNSYTNANPVFGDDGRPSSDVVSWRQFFAADGGQAGQTDSSLPIRTSPDGRSGFASGAQARMAEGRNPSAPEGFLENPYVLFNDEDAADIPPGAYYITRGGGLRQSPPLKAGRQTPNVPGVRAVRQRGE